MSKSDKNNPNDGKKSGSKAGRIAMTVIVAVVVVVLIIILILNLIGIRFCGERNEEAVGVQTENISAQPPEDGSTPTDHDGLENVSYMVYVLAHQDMWHSLSFTKSQASVNNQRTITFKDSRDGVTVAEELSYGTFGVGDSYQQVFLDDEVYLRNGNEPQGIKIQEVEEVYPELFEDYITWDTGEPEYYTRENYYHYLGLFGNELSVFSLNEDSITGWDPAVDNGDGTYTQVIYLDTENSVAYYQYSMKVHGGLSDFPVYESISLTFTFDADWRVLQVLTDEISEVHIGGIYTTNHTNAEIDYSYDEADFNEANFAAYENYFSKYIGSIDAETQHSEDDDGGYSTGDLMNDLIDLFEGGDSVLVSIELADDGILGEFYEELAGLYASIDIYMDINTLDIYMDMTVGYRLGDYDIELGMSILYDYTGEIYDKSGLDGIIDDFGDIADLMYGDVYIDIYRINNAETAMKVKGGIADAYDAIVDLIDAVNGFSGDAGAATANAVASLAVRTMALTWEDLLAGIYIGEADENGNNLYWALDLNDLFELLGLPIDAPLGDAEVALRDGVAYVTTGENIGLTIVIESSSLKPGDVKPTGTYLDVTDVVELIEAAVDVSAEINASRSVFFEIEMTVPSADNSIDFAGFGEVTWGDFITVALRLEAAVSTGDTSASRDAVPVYVLYNGGATGNEEILVIVVGNVGLALTADDFAKIGNDLELISAMFSAFTSLSYYDGIAAYGDATDDDAAILEAIIELLAGDEWVGYLNMLELYTDGSMNLVLGITTANYGGYTLEMGVAGGMNLTVYSDGGLRIYVEAEAGKGYYADAREEIANSGAAMITTVTSGNVYAAIYDFLFASFEDVSISNMLGDGSYEICLMLDGSQSDISALDGVYVAIDMYYTEGVTSETEDGTVTGKLVEMYIDVEVGSTVVRVEVEYFDYTYYITLTEVNGTAFSDVKFKGTTDDIYDLLTELVDFLMNTDLLSMFSAEPLGAVTLTSYEAAQLFTVLASAVTFDFTDYASMLVTYSDEAFRTISVDVDALLEALIGDAYGIGDVTLGFNPETFEFYLSGDCANRASSWLRIYAGAGGRREADTGFVSSDDYFELGFVNYLIDDALNSLTDDYGEFYTLYTFTGTLSLPLDVSGITATVVIDNFTVTLGWMDGDFFVSAVGDLQKATAMGIFTLSTASTVGFTYSDGMITMARGLGTESAEYRVMTTSYFVGQLFNSDVDTSPLGWWLGTSSTIWAIVSAMFGSFLSAPVSYAANEFSLFDYVSGFEFKAEGQVIDSKGTTRTAVEEFGLEDKDNYYAFDANSGWIQSVTGGIVNSAYLAVLRNNEQGISGLYVGGDVYGYIFIDLELGTYLEGLTAFYDCMGTTAWDTAYAAPDIRAELYEYVLANLGINLASENFGCFAYVLGDDAGIFSY